MSVGTRRAEIGGDISGAQMALQALGFIGLVYDLLGGLMEVTSGKSRTAG